MVKPSKGMQPEAVDLEEVNRKGTRGMKDDDFRNYMAGKIDKQRQQFGLMLPPAPQMEMENAGDSAEEESRSKKKRVRFPDDLPVPKRQISRKYVKHYASSIIKRLEKKQNRRKRSRAKSKRRENMLDKNKPHEHETQETIEISDPARPQIEGEKSTFSQSPSAPRRKRRRQRPDLFFYGVVCMINGYTDPDVDTLTRLLQRHGGDREAYETTRVTHILAESLSTAKANIYKKQRRPTPICKPTWITESVRAGKLLPFRDYLIDQVKPETNNSVIKSFFAAERCDTDAHQATSTSSVEDAKEVRRDDDHLAAENDAEKESESTLGPFIENSSTLVDSPVDASNATRPRPNKEVVNEPRFALKEAPSQTNHAGMAPAREAALVESFDGRTHRNGEPRTVGNDPHFLENFFSNSRLSFIGSFKQRARQSPTKRSSRRSPSSQRFVFHVDMDCFFASVVLRKFPQYRDHPVAISHHGRKGTVSTDGSFDFQGKGSTSECATCNYEARKKGVKKGMFLGKAKELCPDLVVLQYDFEGYEEVSEQLADILFRVSATYEGAVEQVSCDEAYVELFLADDEHRSAADCARDIAHGMREEIVSTTQCTATVGVGPNKLMARVATDSVKPNGCCVATDSIKLLGHLKLRDLPGVGYRKERELADQGGLTSVRDVWELGDQAESELVRILGPSLGKKLCQFCSGRDVRPVKAVERKTIGAECNYGVRFNGPYGPHDMVEGLAKEVVKRMEGLQMRGSQIILKVKKRKPNARPPPKFLGHGSCFNLSSSSRTLSNPTRECSVIAKIASSLLDTLQVQVDDIRGMGITMKDLVGENRAQRETSTSKPITAWYHETKPDSAAPSVIVLSSHQNELTAHHDVDSVAQEEETAARSSLPSSMSQVDGVVFDSLPEDIRNEIRGAFGNRSQATSIAEDCKSCLNSIVDPCSQDDRKLPVEENGNEWVNAADDDDIEIPSRSQIAMSQVEKLPSPMRKRILSKINHDSGNDQCDIEPLLSERFAPNCSSIDVSRTPALHLARKKQQNIHRMLKLMAVKSGNDDLADTLGESVSLTQLETLPLAMQLQVANNDAMPVVHAPMRPTEQSPHRDPSRSESLQSRSLPVGRHGAASLDGTTSPPKKNNKGSYEGRNDVPIDLDSVQDEEFGSSFYRDNLVPLREFMNEQTEAPDDAVVQAKEFLLICTSELRFPDAIKLLRHIRHRSDEWGTRAYSLLFDAVNTESRKLLGGPIDSDWAGL